MSNSNLVSYTKISPNKNSPRNHKIDTITIHCVVGQCSIEVLGSVFNSSSRQASSNYGIGYDGRVGMYVEEKDRSWCTSSYSNDNRAITIEVASDTTPPYRINTKAYNSLIKLVTDICKRNKIEKLIWSTNKNERMNHLNGCNVTVHRDYANKSCPGDYIYDKLDQIVKEVNQNLGNSSETEEPEIPDKPTSQKVDVYYRVKTNGRWLPEVKNLEDYAGIKGKEITDVAIKVNKGSIKYRVRTNGKWLPYVGGYNIKDAINGYAGNGTPIDCIEVYYYTPDNIRPYQQAYYRVSPVNKGYYSWQKDNSTAGGMDGYAGVPGKYIDRLQIEIKK